MNYAHYVETVVIEHLNEGYMKQSYCWILNALQSIISDLVFLRSFLFDYIAGIFLEVVFF